MTTATINTTAAELQDAATAISFALDHLEPWEVHLFLKDWRDEKDLEPWLEEAEEKGAA